MRQEGRMKRYIKPGMKDLNASRAEGDCIAGTGDAIYCSAGNTASTGGCENGADALSCSSGSVAGFECSTGNQYSPT